MIFRTKLCHVGEEQVIVCVSAWNNNNLEIGSALGVGTSAEIAEDRAIDRLKERITSNINNHSEIIEKDNNFKIIEGNSSTTKSFINEIPVPTDWSKELAEIDLHVKKLSWTKDQENNYLKEKFGYKDRSRITNYATIKEFLKSLELLTQEFKSLTDPNTRGIDRKNLLELSDQLIHKLSWSESRGREYIKEKYNAFSRSELSDEELLSFISYLKKQ